MGTQVLPGTMGPALRAPRSGVQGDPARGQGRRAHHTAMLNNNHPHIPYKSDSKNRQGNKTFG